MVKGIAESGTDRLVLPAEAAILVATPADMRAPCKNAMIVASSSLHIAGTIDCRTKISTKRPRARNIVIFVALEFE